jgi:hypothetical protein
MTLSVFSCEVCGLPAPDLIPDVSGIVCHDGCLSGRWPIASDDDDEADDDDESDEADEAAQLSRGTQ